MSDKTCAERVAEHWASRRDDLHHMLFPDDHTAEELAIAEVDPDDPTGTFCEYGLGFDYVAPGTFTDQKEGFFRYLMSTGGPGDELRFFTNPDFSVHRIEYWFLDWFDGAHLDVTHDEVARAVFEWFNELDALRHAFEQGME